VSTLAALACLVAAGEARPARIVVDTDAELRAAIERLAQPGGEIVVQPGRYAPIVVGPRSWRKLTIYALRASTRSLRLVGSRNVRIVGLRVSSARPPSSEVELVGAHHTVLERRFIRGRDRSRVRVRLMRSVGIVIRKSLFRRCGEEDACVLLGRSRKISILSNEFQRCHNCDSVRGKLGGSGLIVRDNLFGTIVRAHCVGSKDCNHQDHLQIQRGTDIVIERNRFGVYEHGAAQIYLTGPLDRVRIANNAFRATDPSRPGLVSQVGIRVGNRAQRDHPPFHVVIAHNTILSGARHVGKLPSRASVVLSPLFPSYPVSVRPVLVNNVLALLETPESVCGRARSSTHNIVRTGHVCSAADTLTDPLIGSVWGVPNAASRTIDLGQAGWAVRDINSVPRDELPDIGAYEYIGT
jgi:hypothetical protein